MLIKNFFGFGKDGLNIDGVIISKFPKLDENLFNKEDKDYIKKNNIKSLERLGKRLELKKNLVFGVRKKRKSKAKKLYKYKGVFYTIYALNKMSGLKVTTLYGRIVTRKWDIEKALNTNLINNGIKRTNNSIKKIQ